MSDAIIVAIITGLCSIFGQWLITKKNRRDTEIKRAVREQKVDDRLNAIELKLDIHNNYADKLGDIQRDLAVLANEIQNLKGA